MPWAIAGAGVAAIALGLLVGTSRTFSCDDCREPAWPGWVIIGGSAAATGGTIWIVANTHDQSELRYRREHIEEELEHERWNLEPAPVGKLSLSFSGRL